MRKDSSWSWYLLALAGADALLLVLAFVLATAFRSAFDILPQQPDLNPERYSAVGLVVIPGLLGIFWLRRAYARQHLLEGPEEYARVVSGCTYGTLLVIAASYLYGGAPLVARGWLLLFWCLSIILVSTGRFTMRRVAHGLRRYGRFVRRVLVAGANDQGMAIARQLHGPLTRGVQVIGFLDDYLAPGTPLMAWHPGPGSQGRQGRANQGDGIRFPILGRLRQAKALAAQHTCDLLIVVPTALSWESQQELARLGHSGGTDLEVRLAPTQYDLTATGVCPAPLGAIPLLQLQPARITGADAVLQRVVDASLAAVLLVVLAPVLAWVVVKAWVQGTRPVFVHQRVLGYGGRVVTLSLLNPQVSGRLLPRGLPALLAVLRGQMALVGPQPVPEEERAQVRRWAGLLLAVKPGLTGPWRLTHPAASVEERVLADVWWVRNWSIWQHLFVLFQVTLRAWRGVWSGPSVARWAGDEAGYLRPAPAASTRRALPDALEAPVREAPSRAGAGDLGRAMREQVTS